MRAYVIAAATLAIFALTSSASAQSLYEKCEKRKGEISNLQGEVTQIDADVAEINKKINKINTRLVNLRRERKAKNTAKVVLNRKIKLERAKKARMCKPLRHCAAHEKKIAALQAKIDPMAARLKKIREEIRNRTTGARIQKRVERIENQYKQLDCDNMVPGETAQNTIDTCTSLFSEWNKLLTEVNQLQKSVKGLRAQYRRIMKKMKQRNKELASLAKKMRRSCRHSQRLSDLELMEKRQHEFRTLKKDLDDVDTRVKRYKAMKILRPKMNKKHTLKPKKKEKHTLKPKKKEKHTLKPKKKEKKTLKPTK